MPTSRFIHLKPEDDTRLRKIEQDPYLKPKVRLRAQVLRLSHRGTSIEQIASYTGRSRTSIGRDFERWEQQGFEGLADGSAPGNPPRVTEEVKLFLKEKLSEERTYNASQLAEVLEERFGLKVTPEAIRQHLLAMGYRWKRTRYVPSHPPDPQEELKAKEELQGLKRGLSRAN
jgi:transposase